MLRLHQLPLSLHEAVSLTDETLRTLCAQRLRVPVRRVISAELQKRSVDARDKGDVHFALTVDVSLSEGTPSENDLAQKFRPNQVALVGKAESSHTDGLFSLHVDQYPKDAPRPLVVGAGPAGLFCALALAMRGAKPLLIERGQSVEERTQAVERLEKDGMLDPENNVLFGEGGAGAFSDGKLTCGLNNPHIRTVLQTLAACGAPEEILTAQRPHIGTDELCRVLKNLRSKLLALGGEVRFGWRLDGLSLQNGRIAGARVWHNGLEERIQTGAVFLAVGHSARDTYQWLHDIGIPMQPKPFAVGVRIEHLQQSIDASQYGRFSGHAALPPAEYKLNVKTPDGRGVYTFCMCPGGRVINASSEAGALNVNGMSLHARDGRNANAAVLVGITPADFGSEHPLAGVEFQRRMEQAAFEAGGGSYTAPCQRVGDFLAGQKSKAFGSVLPTYRPGVALGEIAPCLPAFVADNLRFALPRLGRLLAGFDHPDALLTAPETRSSAPVRMLRNEWRESPVGGLYPLGEGAGYAGGIISAAVDGLCAGLQGKKEEAR